MFCKFRKTKSTNLSVRRGFSLVELLITMAIGVVMTSVLFAVKNNDSAARDVDVAAQQVAAQLRALQNDALSGKKIEAVAGSGVLTTACTYRFDSTAETSFTVSYFNDCSFDPSNLVMNLPPVTLKNVKLTAGSIYFQSPRGETNGNNRITITSTKNLDVKIYVLISQAGNVEVSKSGTQVALACLTPWLTGDIILNGGSVPAFSATSVACGVSCASVAETRTCTDGVLSGSFSNQVCNSDPCPCTLPASLGGATIPSGATVQAFQAPSAECGSTCAASETRTCENGVLSGSFLYQSCTVNTCACTSFDYTATQECQPDGTQTVAVANSYPIGCAGGSPATTQSCTYAAPTCSSFTYSGWGTCQSNGTQTRSVWTSSPSGCTGGSPVTTLACLYTPVPSDGVCSSYNSCASGFTGYCSPTACDYVSGDYYCAGIDGGRDTLCGETSSCYCDSQPPPPPTCSSFTYGAWGACQPNSVQSRSVLTSDPSGCTGGSPSTIQSCTYVGPTCTSFTYSSWGYCQTNDTQSRVLISSSPADCTGGTPVLTQSCAYVAPVNGVCSGANACSSGSYTSFSNNDCGGYAADVYWTEHWCYGSNGGSSAWCWDDYPGDVIANC